MGGCATRPGRVIHPMVRSLSVDERPSINVQENLESYSLFWLDGTAKSPENIEVRDELRAIINYTKIFESTEEFIRDFEKITHGKIFLIVNYAQGFPLLSRIHNYQELYSIYIYTNGQLVDNNQIVENYNKVRGVYDSLSEAKRYLEDDVRLHTDLDDPMVLGIEDIDEDLAYKEKFSLFVKLVNCKAKDIYDSETRDFLIKTYSKIYEGNETEKQMIDQFSNSYAPEDAISWYTRGFCLRRLLTCAFNEQNMKVLADMFSFIVDVNRNIKANSSISASRQRLYRGQFISDDGLLLFKDYINRLVTMQCFFSAQTSRDEIVDLLQRIEPCDKTWKRVIFEIDASQDYIVVDNSQSSTSKTALFMLGTVFKIVDVTDTTIVLSQYNSDLNGDNDLANESPIVIKGMLTYLKKGTIDAIRYFQRHLDNLPEEDLATRSSIHGQLGYLLPQTGNARSATQMYEKAMNDRKTQFSVYLFYLDQAAKHYANVVRDWEKARSIWLQKLNIQNALQFEEGKVQTYENLARASLMTKQYAKAIEYTSAAIEILPQDHPHINALRDQLESAKKQLNEGT